MCIRAANATVGGHTFKLDYFWNIAAGKGDQSYFFPIENVIKFDGKKHYQEEISAQAVDSTTKLSYCDAFFLHHPSASQNVREEALRVRF